MSDCAALAVTWEDWLAALAAAAADGLQVREKTLTDSEVHALAARARAALPKACVTVNGRADLARAAGADGAHLPADGVPLARLRERFGEAMVLGQSTHRVAEVESARAAGADYVTFGPVFATPSKAAFGEPVGIAALRDAVTVGIPVYALGGMSAERLEEVAAAGAFGAAGIRMFADPARLQALVARARRVFPTASESA